VKLKVTTVVGTRPELIRMAKILSKFDEQFDHRIIHTGQNSGDELKDVFFRDLNIREPDLQFDMRSSNLGTSLARLFEVMGEEFVKNRPDALVILGDTNSALCGILAKRASIPFYHLEAGLRSFDKNVPEEINRRVIDHTADFNMVYTEHARRNLLTEGLHPRTISLIGSPMREVLEANSKAILESRILEQIGISKKSFYLISLHRQENVDNTQRLKSILGSLEDLTNQTKFPIMFSTHPRTRDRINELGFKPNKNMIFHEPFGFNDYCKLQLESNLVLSDSGSISEEASILGFKAITLRDSMERPEALDSGSIVMSGANSSRLVEYVKFVESSPIAADMPSEYKITDTSERVIKFILSTISEYNFWFGIRNN
jgi:UDP-N-acetylglucosamine 2-epimerase (non-hydrolysing)